MKDSMKDGVVSDIQLADYRTLSRLCVIVFAAAANALVSFSVQAGVDVSGKLPGTKEEFARGSPTFESMINVDGKKAASLGMLARLKGGPNKQASASAMMDKEGLIIAQRFNLVPGLVRLSQKSGGSQRIKAEDVKATIKRLKASGAFSYVEPDWQVRALTAPNDSAYVGGLLWGLRNIGQSGGVAGVDINVLSAWNTTTGADSVVVGVVDTGIRYTHQDLVSNMWQNPGEIAGNGLDDDNNGYIDDVYGINAINGSGNPMDYNGHGTHVAGTIAASGFDVGQHVGVAYTSKLMGLKFLDSSGRGSTSDAIRCIEYAVANGVDILNNSWGGGGFSQALLDAIEAANEAGVLFVAAAGNEASNNDVTPSYPANYGVDNVISVAAIDRTGSLANFSNFGVNNVDIAAPGVSILSSTSGSNISYSSFNGTSMAAPHVSGVAALVLSANPSASIGELRNRLLASAAPLATLSGRVATGGMIDATEALGLSADGDMEISVIQPTLESGNFALIEIRVTDLDPVINASVSANFNGGAGVVFTDNGLFPDDVGGDGMYTGQIPVPSSGTTVTMNVSVSAPGKNNANLTVEFPVVTPAVNDDFEDRIVLAPGSTSTSGSNEFASAQAGEPTNPSVAGGASVWWEWLAPPTSSVATISTSGSAFDTTLAIYTGTSINGLSLVGSNDDSGGFQSAVSFNAQPGQIYQIQVDGYAGSTGAIQLNYPSPGGASGVPVIEVQPTDQSTLVGAPFNLEVRASGTPSPTYQWFRVENEVLSPIGDATSQTYLVVAAAEADQGVYAVLVSNTAGQVLSQSVFVSVEQVSLLPNNDDFADAQLLLGGTGRVNSSTARATGEPGEPDHAFVSGDLSSVWFRWLAPASGDITIDTFGSDYDTTLAVYTGDNFTSFNTIAVNDDAAGLQSAVTFFAVGGTVYQIAVDGFSDRQGQVVLNYEFAGGNAVDNDALGSRAFLQATDSVSSSNIGASGEQGEPIHAGVSSPLASMWWSWEAPTAGVVTLSTTGSNFDTTIAVYTGNSVGSLSTVASNDDFTGLQSQVSFSANGGTTYLIAVDGYASSEGDITLSSNFTPAVIDSDGDGINDVDDNCLGTANLDQQDDDNDGAGNVCDAFPNNPGETADSDGDGMGDAFEDRYELDRNSPDDGGIDSDGDGRSNLEEFLDGTSPREFDAFSSLNMAILRAALCTRNPAPDGC